MLLSGILAQTGGIQACLWGSAGILAVCLVATTLLPTTRDAVATAAPVVKDATAA